MTPRNYPKPWWINKSQYFFIWYQFFKSKVKLLIRKIVFDAFIWRKANVLLMVLVQKNVVCTKINSGVQDWRQISDIFNRYRFALSFCNCHICEILISYGIHRIHTGSRNVAPRWPGRGLIRADMRKPTWQAMWAFWQLCAQALWAPKNGLPLFLGYVITIPELNEVQFCLCMASSVKKYE